MRSRYDAFGNNVGNEGAISNQYLFASEQFDSSLGDYYLRDRFYDVESGRFSRRDIYAGRLAEPQTLHKYIYAHNDPVNLTDPSGFIAVSVDELNVTFILEVALIRLYANQSSTTSLGNFSSRESVEDFVDAYVYFAKKKAKDTSPEDSEDEPEEGDDQSKQRHGGGKNAQHGKAEDLPSHQKQLGELEEKLKNATGRKEKVQISNKIKRLKDEMARRRKGENHSQREKR